MKKFLSLIVLTSLFFVSCSSDGERGPQGPAGEDGIDGLDGLGYTYERTINFDYFSDANLYSQLIEIPDDVATFEPESDAVLVYRLEILDADDGGTIDSWSLIPQNFFIGDGTIQYVYNHTVSDVEIIIDGNFDLSNLSSEFIDNQTFRIVVLPSATFEANADVDFSNFGEVQKRFDLDIK
ncbi:hypothetical protein [Christiangramia forsetii]|uniref:Membrane or secreted protein n=2 Tax=Christiangramia forsetii TaxID=411153 RepID=A0M2I9_CHRFK|nr:hypothetical protein [Christiangramia forsetii]GGG38990.1 hypothetical protein GCM10011532_23460 [Christiangramia forsetii]CAL66834.1 membrane or secreted protein [Christiangramia forsetii KT0803]